jgi:3'-5' exonuclease
VVDYVIVWDLETVPDADAFARVYGLLNPSPSKIHEIIGMEFPKLPLHRIVCIGALIASSSPTGWVVESLGAPHIGERTESVISAIVTPLLNNNAIFRSTGHTSETSPAPQPCAQ